MIVITEQDCRDAITVVEAAAERGEIDAPSAVLLLGVIHKYLEGVLASERGYLPLRSTDVQTDAQLVSA